MQKDRLFIKIFGTVQGVFFRDKTLEKAEELGLSGYVKNALDGSVEIEAEGAKEDLERLLEWAYHGPSSAIVKKVEARWQEGKGEFSDFKIVY